MVTLWLIQVNKNEYELGINVWDRIAIDYIMQYNTSVAIFEQASI